MNIYTLRRRTELIVYKSLSIVLLLIYYVFFYMFRVDRRFVKLSKPVVVIACNLCKFITIQF